MKKQEVINAVNESISSIFTKEDVLKLLEMITDGGAQDGEKTYTVAQVNTMISDLVEEIKNEVENIDSEDIVRTDDVQLSLSGNEIYVDSVDVNTREIKRAISSAHDGFDVLAYEFNQ